MAAATSMTVVFKDLRCSCHRLIARVSSTSSARIESKCSRCAKVTLFQVSTGSR